MRKLLSSMAAVAVVIAGIFALTPNAASAATLAPSTAGWTITIVDSQGDPVRAGTYDFRTVDNMTQSSSYVATTDGVVTFPRLPPAGQDVNLTLTSGFLSNGHVASGRWRLTPNRDTGIATVAVPAEPTFGTYSAKVTVDDNKPATAASANPVVPGVTVNTNLTSYATYVASDTAYNFRFSMQGQTSGVTDSDGIATFTAYNSTNPVTASVRYTDSTGAHDTSASNLAVNATTTFTLPAYSYLSGPAAVTAVASPTTLTTWNVKVNSVGTAATTVTLAGPHEATIACAGSILSTTVAANGTAVLKACPGKSGVYTFSAPGVVSTTTLVKVTGTAPLEISNLSASAPTTNTVRLNWTAPSFTGGSAVTGYEVQAWASIPGQGTVTQDFTLTSTATTVDLNGFAGGYVWNFTVAARNVKGLAPAKFVGVLVTGSSSIAPIMREAPALPSPLVADGSSFRVSVGDWVGNPTPAYTSDFFWCTVATSAGTTLDQTHCTEATDELVVNSNSTGRDFMVFPADIGKYLVFAVKGVNTAGESSWYYTAGALVRGPQASPAVTGTYRVGNTITISKGNLYPTRTWRVQWLLDNVAISGATNMSYKILPSDYDHGLSAVVIFDAVNPMDDYYGFVDRRLVGAGTLTSTPVPTLPATVAAGQTVTVTPGTWNQGTELSYVWKLDGVAVDGATSASFTVPYSAASKNLTVSVTGALSGFTSVTKTSVAKRITAATLTLKPNPSIAGAAVYGSELTANTGTWDSGVTFAYQWKRAGVAITGATSSTYTVTTADVSRLITVTVTGSKDGFTPVTNTSASVTPTLATFNQAPTPTVAGDGRVGTTYTASVGNWPTGTTFTYKWMRGTTAISGATGLTYTAAASDANASLKFVVTASKAGYVTISKESVASTVALGIIGRADPVFSATPAYGTTATVNLGASSGSSSPSLSYVWKVDGVTVPNAIGATYTPTFSDIGKTLQLEVTASKAGYLSETKTTPAVTVTRATFATPTFTRPTSLTNYLYDGTLGNYCMTANIYWTVSNANSATLSYQWFRIPSGSNQAAAIDHATNAQYQLEETAPGARFYVEVTYIKSGYTTATFTSPAKAAASACSGGR